MTPTEERNVRLRETFGSAEKKKIENDGEHQKNLQLFNSECKSI